MKENKFDLTQGGILNRLLIVALPVMGTQFMQMAYNLTDMFWLGRLSSDAVAASGTAGMYMWLAMGFMILGTMGLEIGVSQNTGRNDPETAHKYAQNGMLLELVIGALYGGALIIFASPLIGIFNIQEAHVAEASVSYLRIVGIGIPLLFVSAAAKSTYTSTGNSRLPFYINTVGLIVNMVLDPLMIFTFGWEIKGAAVATVIAQALVCILSVLAIKLHKNRPFATFRLFSKPDFEVIRQMLRWSFPVALESLLFTSLAMITTRIMAGFGVQALTVQRVGSQIESLSWLIGGGFGIAVTTYMGQNYGAQKWERINKGYRVSTFAMLIWGTSITVGLFFGGYLLFGIFINEPEIKSMGATYLKVLALSQIPMCIEGVASGTFRGSGRTVPPSLVSITSNIIRVPLVYFLSRTSLGVDGIWWGIATCTILRGSVIYIWNTIRMRGQPKQDAVAVE